MKTDRTFARQLASESLSRGQPLAWFELLYQQAAGNELVVPWADMAVNPNLKSWLERRSIEAHDRKALVVGCGLGDDAEALCSLGFQVTAFDVSETAIAWCRQRFPQSQVDYKPVDLFEPLGAWMRAFEFVYEAYTLQVLPVKLRRHAMERIAEFVAPGGTLLMISRGRDDNDDLGSMPWPLVREELRHFTSAGLVGVNCEDFFDTEEPPVRRFRAEYHRP